jgi:ribonuclease T2
VKTGLFLLATLAFLPGLANAQALSCQVPATIERPRFDGPDEKTPRRLIPTAGYTLAISWSPQYCRDWSNRPSPNFQCQRDNRFGFVLHGLWPDGAGKVWPQYCRAVPLLSEKTIWANLCMTPSAQLLQHEWAKHGSCMSATAEDYFGRARKLYAALRFPDMAALSRREALTAGSVSAAIARANRGLAVNNMRVTATREGWMEEVWICLDRSFRYRRCPAHQGGAEPARPAKIWRGD